MSIKKLLDNLFQADRAAHDAEARVLDTGSRDDLASALTSAVDAALSLDDAAEANPRLIRLADLCAQVQGQSMAEALIRILNVDEASVRVSAGEALRDFAYDRYAEVARAIEQALQQQLDGPAMEELPWVLAEVGEPSAVPLIAEFLNHSSIDIVAAGIEALAELGDSRAASHLEALKGDERVAQLTEGDASYTSTIGELAEEALGELSE